MHNYFDGVVAETYDAGSPEMFAPDVLGPTVDFLAGLAGDRPALELAIGTGRVALPLSRARRTGQRDRATPQPWSTSCGPSRARSGSTSPQAT